jgi:hypothetical protein
MNLMPPGVIKIRFFSIFWTFTGGFLLKTQEPSEFSFLLLVMKKDTYNDISSRMLKTK